jgi:hypothetical protein
LNWLFDRDDSPAAIEAEEWVSKRFERLHPDGILRVEGLSRRLALPDDAPSPTLCRVACYGIGVAMNMIGGSPAG